MPNNFFKVNHIQAAKDVPVARSQGTRANKESGDRIAASDSSRVVPDGNFVVKSSPSFIVERGQVFDRLLSKYSQINLSKPEIEISVTLPDGSVKRGRAFHTSPYDIAKEISQGLADNVVIAKVQYTSKYEEDSDVIACDEDDEAMTASSSSSNESEVLWDLNRPLIGDCHLKLLKFEDSEAKTVFWHSSAHVLGAALEAVYGAYLTIGPPLQSGFYYDCFIGNKSILEDELKVIEDKTSDICKQKYPFQRLKITRDEALELFASNPFKVQLIKSKIPEDGYTTVYRCGPLIDLCMGPHLPHTGRIKAFATVKTSSTNWLGKVTNDPLQRIYGISFPEKTQLKQWKEFQEQAKLRDHRFVSLPVTLFHA